MTVEEIENKRKRVIFRSWHRGTKEMDLILGRFAESFIPDCSLRDLDMYETLLLCSDPDLYRAVTGKEELEDKALMPLVGEIKKSLDNR